MSSEEEARTLYSQPATASPDPEAATFHTNEMLYFGGWLFLIGGLLAVSYSFFIETALPSTYDGSRTYNLGLLQPQMMVFQAGAAAAVIGSVLVAVAELHKLIERPEGVRTRTEQGTSLT